MRPRRPVARTRLEAAEEDRHPFIDVADNGEPPAWVLISVGYRNRPFFECDCGARINLG